MNPCSLLKFTVEITAFFGGKCAVPWSKWRTFSSMHEIYCFKCYRDWNEGSSWVFIQTFVFYPCFCPACWEEEMEMIKWHKQTQGWNHHPQPSTHNSGEGDLMESLERHWCAQFLTRLAQ